MFWQKDYPVLPEECHALDGIQEHNPDSETFDEDLIICEVEEFIELSADIVIQA